MVLYNNYLLQALVLHNFYLCVLLLHLNLIPKNITERVFHYLKTLSFLGLSFHSHRILSNNRGIHLRWELTMRKQLENFRVQTADRSLHHNSRCYFRYIGETSTMHYVSACNSRRTTRFKMIKVPASLVQYSIFLKLFA